MVLHDKYHHWGQIGQQRLLQRKKCDSTSVYAYKVYSVCFPVPRRRHRPRFQNHNISKINKKETPFVFPTPNVSKQKCITESNTIQIEKAFFAERSRIISGITRACYHNKVTAYELSQSYRYSYFNSLQHF